MDSDSDFDPGELESNQNICGNTCDNNGETFGSNVNDESEAQFMLK